MKVRRDLLLLAIDFFKFGFRDDFTTAQAAPLGVARTAEPGPGTWAITDTTKFSVAAEKIYLDGAVNNTSLAKTDVLSTNCGLAFATRAVVRVTGPRAGFGRDVDPINQYRCQTILYSTDNLFIYSASFGSFNGYGFGFGAERDLIIVRLTDIAVVIISDGDEYKIIFVTEIVDQPVVGFVSAHTGTADADFDFVRIANLTGQFATKYGITDYYAAAKSAGDTGSTQVNSIIDATWTAVAGQTFEISVRRTDDNNRWIIRADEATNTIKIIERDTGVETERASGALTINAGTDYSIRVYCDHDIIYATCIATKIRYGAASFNNTATGWKISHNVTDFALWPVTITGYPLYQIGQLLGDTH